MQTSTLSPIALAVEPLRAVAVERAEKEARAVVARVFAELEANGWNADLVAPYPKSTIGREAYMKAKAKVTLVSSLTKNPPGVICYSMKDDHIVVESPEGVERFVQFAKEDAEAQYTAFVGKLEGKIGETKTAKLEGNHVWGYSFLTVETVSGEVEIWKTQMIVNVSKLGKLFNQFPTRKVKNYK